jgi:hypothetical protein
MNKRAQQYNETLQCQSVDGYKFQIRPLNGTLRLAKGQKLCLNIDLSTSPRVHAPSCSLSMVYQEQNDRSATLNIPRIIPRFEKEG